MHWSTLWVVKRDLCTFAYNYGRYWRIFEIFSLLNSSRNLQQSDYCIAHHTFNMLLHYLVKWLLSQTKTFFIKTIHSTSLVTNKCHFMMKFKCKLQRLFKMPPFCMDTGMKSWTPLVDRVVDDALHQTVSYVNTRKLCYRKDGRAMRELLRRYGHSKLAKMAAAAILNLFEP